MELKIFKFAVIVSWAIRLLLCFSPPAHSQGTQDWIEFYDYGTDDNEYARDMVSDAEGNIYITGEISINSGTTYAVTLKYNSSGFLLWEPTYNGTGGDYDYPVALTVDGDGNTCVVVQSDGNSGSSTDYDYATIKYTPEGYEAWVMRYDGSPYGYDNYPADIEVDTYGNVYVTGRSSESSSDYYDYCTLKYDASGNELWHQLFSGVTTASGSDYAYDLAVDSERNVYVTGSCIWDTTSSDITTVKYDPDGNLLWYRRYDGVVSYYDSGSSMILDDMDNVYVVGSSCGIDSSSDVTLIKYSPAGDELWSVTYNGEFGGADAGNQIRLDGNGNIIIGGQEEVSDYNDDYLVLKFDPLGNLLWSTTWGENDPCDDILVDLEVNTSGEIYVTGHTNQSGSTWYVTDWMTLKIDPEGEIMWEQRYAGNNQGSDKPIGIEIDDFGKYVISGYSYCDYGSDDHYDIVTVQYHEDSGSLIDINLLPLNQPIQIPASGGSIYCYSQMANTDPHTVTFENWTRVRLPDGSWRGPFRGPAEMHLAGLSNIAPLVITEVPGSSDPGWYSCEVYVGYYPDDIWDYDTFNFEKLATGEDQQIESWDQRWEYDLSQPVQVDYGMASTASLSASASPNPFNLSTTIQFNLPEAGEIKLDILDLQGRSIEQVLNGWYAAGIHQAQFDASTYSSGVYFFRLQSPENVYSGKILLLK